jgi:hypothetical protein
MTDLTPVITLANNLTLAPDEDKLETFLQAYNDLPKPGNLVEAEIYSLLLQFAVDEYIEVPCTCDHEHEQA